MRSTFERLNSGKMVQWAIAYLAAAWVAIQLVDVLGDQFGWPLAVQQGITWTLAVGLAATVLIAFMHGIARPDTQEPEADTPGNTDEAAGPRAEESAGLLTEGRTALARRDWQDALKALSAADAQEGLAPEDLESLATAAWWTGNLDMATTARERAVTGYLGQGDSERAGLLAILNAEDFAYQRVDSVANGWLARAERLLEGDTESVAYGHLQRLRSMNAMKKGDLDKALTLSRNAHSIAEHHRDLDLQAMSLQDQGRILIALGKVEEGLPLVDEAMACAVSGDLDVHTTGRVYCNMMETCDKLSDYERASQWNEAGTKWCQDYTESIFPGICRVYRAKVLGLRGAWDEAQAEALKASDELSSWLPIAGEAWYQIGDLRLRQGDLPSAESAFHQAHELGQEPFPGMAELRRLEGHTEQARSLIDSVLANPALDGPMRARLLPTKISIAIAGDDLSAAEEAAVELATIADQYPSAAMSAIVAEQRSAVALHASRIDEAINGARSAVKAWSGLGFPFETARTRLILARSFLAAGESAAGELELRAAKSVFEKLGAQLALDETLSLQPSEGAE